LGIAFFRPFPLFLPQSGVMPIYSIGHIAVACLGVIDNLPEIREKFISDGVQFDTKDNVAETLSLLLHHYLESHHLSPIEAMQKMMRKLKGQFALMALVTKGKWLMVGCRDYPLAVGRMRNDSTVYFCTDTKTLFQFTPAMSEVFGNPKPRIFCGTIPQSDDILLSDV
jgi:glucosamine 6-phosphate synthetase-like amidotransferase/phosphosugar isomerase protein